MNLVIRLLSLVSCFKLKNLPEPKTMKVIFDFLFPLLKPLVFLLKYGRHITTRTLNNTSTAINHTDQ